MSITRVLALTCSLFLTTASLAHFAHALMQDISAYHLIFTVLNCSLIFGGFYLLKRELLDAPRDANHGDE